MQAEGFVYQGWAVGLLGCGLLGWLIVSSCCFFLR